MKISAILLSAALGTPVPAAAQAVAAAASAGRASGQAAAAAGLSGPRSSLGPLSTLSIAPAPGLGFSGSGPGISPSLAMRAAPAAAISPLRGLAAAPKAVTPASVRRAVYDENGKVSPRKLDAVFSGRSRKADGLLSALDAAPVGGIAKTQIADQIRDGDIPGALAALRDYRRWNRKRLGRSGRRRVADMEKRLADLPSSGPAAPYRARVESIERMLSGKRFADAALAAGALAGAVRTAGLGEGTARGIALAAFTIVDLAKKRGAYALYASGRARPGAEKLWMKTEAIRRRSPGDFAGSPLSKDPVRVQRDGDCKVQQAYNHPAFAAAREQMPYPVFLRAVETRIDNDFRREGMMDAETSLLYRDFGMKTVRHDLAKSGDELAELLKRHGALMTGIRFEPGKGFKGHDADHAALIQAAYRENGRWSFVVIDSNHASPSAYSFAELKLLGLSDLHSVAPEPGTDIRLKTRDFLAAHGVFNRARPGAFKSFAFWLLNGARELFDLDPIEPARVPNPNAVPARDLAAGSAKTAWWSPRFDFGMWRLARRLRAYRALGEKLPAEAALKTPEGIYYLNKTILLREFKRAGV